MAHALMLYNQKMGGVDLFDQFVATIRSKTWWWLFITWSLNGVMTNAWLLSQKIHSKNIPMLAFLRKTIVTMLASTRRKKLHSLQYAQQISENLRADKFDDVVIISPTEFLVAPSNLYPSTATGPDKVAYPMLKHLPRSGMDFLLHIFRLSWSSHSFASI